MVFAHHFKVRASAFAASIVLLGAVSATSMAASPPALLDFEKHPVEPKGPSLFVDAGAEADVTLPGVATIAGGVILGNETNLPSLAFATPPNDYGTASASVIPGVSATLQSTLTVNVAPAYSCDEVSFTLLNGFTASVIYTADAFDGTTQVASQTFTEASNLSSGFHLYDLKAPVITSVTIGLSTPPTAAGWDFSVDSIAFNQSIQQAVTGNPGTGGTTVPLPSAAWASLSVLAGLAMISAYKSRRAKTT